MRGGYAQRRQIAFDAGRVGTRRPIHDHLRFGKNDRVGAIEFATQPSDLIARPSFQPRHARACPHQHDRSDDGKQNHAKDQCEKRDLVLVDAAMRGEHELLQRQRRLLCRSGRQ